MDDQDAAADSRPRHAPPPKPWAVIMHAPFEGPGLIEEVGAQHGVEFRRVKTYAGEQIPDWHTLGGVVSMGGPIGVSDAEHIPLLEAEMGLLWVAVDQHLPVLGVCLGAQLLAAALGSSVSASKLPEQGFGWVALTPEGADDPVLGPAGSTVPVLHWHQDTFSIPRGSVRLASSHMCRNQAFRAGRNAYGFQFHVELTPQLVDGFAGHLPPGIAITAEERDEIAAAGQGIFDRFFQVALSGS